MTNSDSVPRGRALSTGSALSKETPQGSSLTRRARTLSELHVFVTLLLEYPKVTAKTASNPPAPGTPANNTPSKFSVASKSFVCDSGSICMNCKERVVIFYQQI
ncbi:hypothetical protein AAHE18_17G223300 [Arachis hypogaea]